MNILSEVFAEFKQEFKEESTGLVSSNPNLNCRVIGGQLVVNKNDPFTLNLEIIDKISSQVVTNIAWAVSFTILFTSSFLKFKILIKLNKESSMVCFYFNVLIAKVSIRRKTSE
jgi:hypothetical protein